MNADRLADPPPDPLALFAAWHAEAEAHPAIAYPGAVCLSTVDAGGLPDGRIVLLHEFGAEGFAFFTDRRSAKGRALAERPVAALTFYWGSLERQIRLRGRVEAAPAEAADRYFAERPRRSQVTAWASLQSAPVASRAALEERMETAEKRFAGAEKIPRPPYWTAYRLLPKEIEFWAARTRRLHERVLYTRSEEGGWSSTRLAP